MTRIDDLSAEQVIAHLGMEYLPGEGVWVSLLYRSTHGSAIHALLTPSDFSALHRLQEDELWMHVAGAPVDMLLLGSDGSVRTPTLGRDADDGSVMHAFVPAGFWQGARPRGDWALVSCALAPPFTQFELADDGTDLSAWPEAISTARGLIRG